MNKKQKIAVLALFIAGGVLFASRASASQMSQRRLPSNSRDLSIMNISPAGLDVIIGHEGVRRMRYRDVAGHWTIGVGHLMTASELNSGYIDINGKRVKWAVGLSERQVRDLLSQDVQVAVRAVKRLVKVRLSQNQFDALVSWFFNFGESKVKNSTLLKKLNAGDYDAVPTELKRWVHAGGKRVQGLINRRNAEATQFIS